MSTDLTVLGFRELLDRSQLLSPQLVEEFFRDHPDIDANLLAEDMIRERLLTAFQANQLLKGYADDFFLTEKYKVLDFIGEGGMGKVYLGEHLILHRLVAIKMLQLPDERGGSSSAGAVERFYREARAVAALDHPNIIRVFDVDRRGNDPFIVMEFTDGTDLKELVRRRGALPADRAADYVRQAAAGLEHAHAAGLVHRDIKPSNLMLDRTGVVKLLDLGLARFSQDVARNREVTGRFDAHVVLGTADFMAPEQAVDSTKVDARSDIYSLGCTLYFLLTGRVPFPEGTVAQKMYAHQNRAPDSPSEMFPRTPPGLLWVTERMMAKEPAERFATAAEVRSALAEYAGPPEPPSAEEMPETPASFYRLGLSPAPISAMQSTPRTGSRSGTAKQPSAQIGVASRRAVPPAYSGDDPSISFGPPTVSHHRGVVIGLLAGLLVAAAGIIIWLATRGGHAPPTGNVERPNDSTASKDGSQPPKKTGPFVGVIVNGGGSTLLAPLMQHWAGVYEKLRGVRIDYQEVGSGAGAQGALDRVYLFGAADYPLGDDELESATGETIHLPLIMNAVAPAYNLPGLKQQLRFTGPALASIYLGTVVRWNDPVLRAANPGVDLPNLPIIVIGRADASGTSWIATHYLSQVSAEWRELHGTKAQVKLKHMTEARGNNGVANAISRANGAFGFLDMHHARENNLRVGVVKNRAGKYIEPGPPGVTAAALNSLKDLPPDLRFTMTDAPGTDSYPIAGVCWAILYVDQSEVASARELVAFLRWATHEGQAYAKEMQFTPLPPELVKRGDDKLATVKLPPK
jgi:phosphate ABC transporter phosphate-binding protein